MKESRIENAMCFHLIFAISFLFIFRIFRIFKNWDSVSECVCVCTVFSSKRQIQKCAAPINA